MVRSSFMDIQHGACDCEKYREGKAPSGRFKDTAVADSSFLLPDLGSGSDT